MELKKQRFALPKFKDLGIDSWTMSDFGSFYSSTRRGLLEHANRILRDPSKAEEVSQEAWIKFMLAAPELESQKHAVSYLYRTVENLCIDLMRSESRRPNLLVLDDSMSNNEEFWQSSGDYAQALSAAEDAAIIRQAISLLSPAERAALVMWEVEGRSTKEIAKELGIKESSVRHTVSRARASLRKVLSNYIIDEKRGLTALDLLSTSFMKVNKIAEKVGSTVISIVLLFTAFLGFNTLTLSEKATSINQNFEPSEYSESNSPQNRNSNVFNRETTVEDSVNSIASEYKVGDSQLLSELAFESAQLESAIVMLEALSLLENRE